LELINELNQEWYIYITLMQLRQTPLFRRRYTEVTSQNKAMSSCTNCRPQAMAVLAESAGWTPSASQPANAHHP